jgi:hypothetical protein
MTRPTAGLRPWRRRAFTAVGLEAALSLAVCVSIIPAAVFLGRHGYLPAPFYADKSDTLMDWFNAAYWAHNPGAFRLWRSVYPPLSFLFLDLVSPAACYRTTALAARTCDGVAAPVLAALMIAGFALTLAAYRRAGLPAALPRAIAVCLGSSMLYALERGNLVLVTYPVFVLGFSRVGRRPWLALACAALALNFKPYLLAAADAWVQRQRWRWVMALTGLSLAIYLATWLAFGAGSPVELITDMLGPLRIPADRGPGLMQFASSYDALLMVLLSPGQAVAPLAPFVAALIPALVFLAIALVCVGWAACCRGAIARPDVVSSQRLAAITLAMMFTICTPGGYALIFLLFLVFLEPWRGAGSIAALTGAYLWCVTWDPPLLTLGVRTAYSFLGRRMVTQEITLTLGELIRPAFILMIAYGLIGATLADLRGAARRGAPAADLTRP